MVEHMSYTPSFYKTAVQEHLFLPSSGPPCPTPNDRILSLGLPLLGPQTGEGVDRGDGLLPSCARAAGFSADVIKSSSSWGWNVEVVLASVVDEFEDEEGLEYVAVDHADTRVRGPVARPPPWDTADLMQRHGGSEGAIRRLPYVPTARCLSATLRWLPLPLPLPPLLLLLALSEAVYTQAPSFQGEVDGRTRYLCRRSENEQRLHVPEHQKVQCN